MWRIVQQRREISILIELENWWWEITISRKTASCQLLCSLHTRRHSTHRSLISKSFKWQGLGTTRVDGGNPRNDDSRISIIVVWSCLLLVGGPFNSAISHVKMTKPLRTPTSTPTWRITCPLPSKKSLHCRVYGSRAYW